MWPCGGTVERLLLLVAEVMVGKKTLTLLPKPSPTIMLTPHGRSLVQKDAPHLHARFVTSHHHYYCESLQDKLLQTQGYQYCQYTFKGHSAILGTSCLGRLLNCCSTPAYSCYGHRGGLSSLWRAPVKVLDPCL